MNESYRNQQAGWKLLGPIAIVLITFTVAVFVSSGQWWIGLLLAVVMAAMFGSIATLTSTVERGEVRVAFTAVWPERVIPVAAIRSHAIVRNKWWHGWGFRLIPGGMLYSVWGLDAVEIRYRDPKRGNDRMFRIGTDDPEGLDAAITAALADRR